MEIRFRGLICHAQLTANNGKTRDLAVFMACHDHYSKLMVHKDDVCQSNGEYCPTGDYWCFDIKGLVTTSLGSGFATSRYLPEVPSLMDSRVATGDRTPYDAARNRMLPNARYNAILDLPPHGNYFVYSNYEDKAVFDDKKFGCIAHTVAYVVEVDDEVRINLDVDGHYIIVHPSSIFYMDNRSPDPKPETSHHHSHFQAYANLFVGETKITCPTPDEVKCTRRQIEDKLYCGNHPDLDIDCSNSRFP